MPKRVRMILIAKHGRQIIVLVVCMQHAKALQRKSLKVLAGALAPKGRATRHPRALSESVVPILRLELRRLEGMLCHSDFFNHKGGFMLKKVYWILGLLVLISSVSAHALVCGKNEDCKQWEANHCICGVQAICSGVVGQEATGNCQCFGAEGVCDAVKDTPLDTSVGDKHIAPAAVKNN